MKRIITISSNNNYKSLYTKDVLTTKLIQADFGVSDKVEEGSELLICIGGDGSFLKAIHDFKFPDIPIVGINTGHLGFFPEISPDHIDEFIESYKNSDFFIQEITPLEATVCTKSSCEVISAINEVVIKSVGSRTVHLELKVDQNKIQTFSGDGILISTPTGSTAYNYSAGGSIVDPKLKLLQLTPISPINSNAYRSFTSSIILHEDSTIKISPEYRFENSILVVVDGEEYRFNDIVDIQVVSSDLKLNLLRLPNYEFWNRVSEKFL